MNVKNLKKKKANNWFTKWFSFFIILLLTAILGTSCGCSPKSLNIDTNFNYYNNYYLTYFAMMNLNYGNSTMQNAFSDSNNNIKLINCHPSAKKCDDKTKDYLQILPNNQDKINNKIDLFTIYNNFYNLTSNSKNNLFNQINFYFNNAKNIDNISNQITDEWNNFQNLWNHYYSTLDILNHEIPFSFFNSIFDYTDNNVLFNNNFNSSDSDDNKNSDNKSYISNSNTNNILKLSNKQFQNKTHDSIYSNYGRLVIGNFGKVNEKSPKKGAPVNIWNNNDDKFLGYNSNLVNSQNNKFIPFLPIDVSFAFNLSAKNMNDANNSNFKTGTKLLIINCQFAINPYVVNSEVYKTNTALTSDDLQKNSTDKSNWKANPQGQLSTAFDKAKLILNSSSDAYYVNSDLKKLFSNLLQFENINSITLQTIK